MAINYKKITYKIGTALEVHCTEYWPHISGDYEIIGYVDIKEMQLMGLDFYDMHFKNVGQDKFYNSLLESATTIYMMKPVSRNPYLYQDTTEGVDTVTEYLYLADGMIDKNNTIELVKRIHVASNVIVGTYYEHRLNKAFEDKLTSSLVGALDSFSDKYYVNGLNRTMVLQPINEAEEEDRDFIEKQERLERERLEALAKERQRLEAINEREKNVTIQETALIRKRKEIQMMYQDAEDKLKEAEAKLAKIVRQEESLRLREIQVAERTAELNKRAARIKERETQLGLPHTNL